MKKTVLSLAAISMLAVTGANASTSSEIKALKANMAEMNAKISELEKQDEETAELAEKYKKATPVFAKTSKLKFSGVNYLGFVHQVDEEHAYNYTDSDGTNYSAAATTNSYDYFSTRRNYLQVKAYFDESSKSYMRVTLDTHQVGKGVPNAGDWAVRLKYAYLYIDEILPSTGVEFGQAHRPWIDYEEHHGWYYRSIAKVFVESKGDTDFTNSADLGINFKTKTDYFSSELGIFNGEGYHGLIDKDLETGVSFEWRLTANILGTGKKHVHKMVDTYLDASFFGQYNQDYEKKGEVDQVTGESGDFVWFGLNAVYNQPNFLINATYAKATQAGIDYKGNGWSVNSTYRFIDEWTGGNEYLQKMNLIGRYDYYELDAWEDPRESWIAGVTYVWNKNVEFILNYTNNKDPRIIIDEEDASVAHAPQEDKLVMFTASVVW